MGKFSRSKGKRGELEVVQGYQAAGYPSAHRNTIDGQVDGDIADIPDYAEVRRREKLNFSGWVQECREKCGPRPWALWTRRSGEQWAVTIEGDRYLALLAQARTEPKVVRHYITAAGNVIPMDDA